MASCKLPAQLNRLDRIQTFVHNDIRNEHKPARYYYPWYDQGKASEHNKRHYKKVGKHYIKVVLPETPDEKFKIRFGLPYGFNEDHFTAVCYHRCCKESISQG